MKTLGNGIDEIDRSMKKRRVETIFNQTPIENNLPDHLIIDQILPRLPVKSLICFKTVCKLWFSIISSYEFAKTHLKFSSLCSQFVVLIEDHCIEKHYELLLLSYDDSNNNNVGDLIRLDFDHNWVFTKLDIVGCCNGLLCLYLEVESRYGYFNVWNPVTRQCREIKNPDGEYLALDYGFGYAASVDDYKIVVSFSSRTNGIGDFYVFSLRLGKWKRIDGLDNVTVVVGDTLYWLSSTLKIWDEIDSVAALDLVDDKLKEIPWMNWFHEYKSLDFFVMKEFVSLFCRNVHSSDVWVLKKYGEGSSWEKLFSVNHGGVFMLNFTQTGKVLVINSDQLKVIDSSQDSLDESQEGADIPGLIRGTGVYVESLISPFVLSLET